MSLKQFFKTVLESVSTSEERIYETPKRKIRIKPIYIASMILIPFLATSIYLSCFAHKKDNFIKNLPKENIVLVQENPIKKKLFEEENKKEVKIYFSQENKKIISAEVLKKVGTTFENSNILKYTKEGIKVPAKNYSVLIEGKDYFPNENLFIKIPEELINEKVRLTKFDLDKKGKEKYLASFATKIKKEFSKETTPDKNVKLTNLENLVENSNLDKKEKVINLENICFDNQIKEKKDKQLFACSEENFYQEYLDKYSSSRKGRKNINEQVVEGLSKGYKFSFIKDSLKNKDGSMRSDLKILKNLKFEGNKNLIERAKELIEKGNSLEKVAKIIKEETKNYFSNGEKMNISADQISKELKKDYWISKTEYESKIEFYNSLEREVIIYSPKSVQKNSPRLK